MDGVEVDVNSESGDQEEGGHTLERRACGIHNRRPFLHFRSFFKHVLSGMRIKTLGERFSNLSRGQNLSAKLYRVSESRLMTKIPKMRRFLMPYPQPYTAFQIITFGLIETTMSTRRFPSKIDRIHRHF
jgi:hypothetical protein